MHCITFRKYFSSKICLDICKEVVKLTLILRKAVNMCRSSRLQMFFKIGLFEIFAKSPGKHLLQSLFLKKRLAQALSCEFCKVFKNNFFIEYLRSLLCYVTPKMVQLNGRSCGYYVTIYPRISQGMIQRISGGLIWSPNLSSEFLKYM